MLGASYTQTHPDLIWYTVANAIADKIPESEPQISSLNDTKGDIPFLKCFPMNPLFPPPSAQDEQTDRTHVVSAERHGKICSVNSLLKLTYFALSNSESPLL